MKTLAELFKEYVETAYDVAAFDPHTLSEMRSMFFAGAMAVRRITHEGVDAFFKEGDIYEAVHAARILEKELEEFMAQEEAFAKSKIN